MSQNLDLNIEIIAKRCNNYNFPAGHITTGTVVNCTTLSCIFSGGSHLGELVRTMQLKITAYRCRVLHILLIFTTISCKVNIFNLDVISNDYSHNGNNQYLLPVCNLIQAPIFTAYSCIIYFN